MDRLLDTAEILRAFLILNPPVRIKGATTRERIAPRDGLFCGRLFVARIRHDVGQTLSGGIGAADRT